MDFINKYYVFKLVRLYFIFNYKFLVPCLKLNNNSMVNNT